MTDRPLIGGADFTGIVAFSMMICFLWLGMHKVSLGCAPFGPLPRCAGSPLAVRIFFTWRMALCSFGNELLQIECLRGVLISTSAEEYPRTIVGLLFWWYQDDNRSSYPRLGQCAHCHTKHKQGMNLDCCEVVRALCCLVIGGLVPTAAEKPTTCDT